VSIKLEDVYAVLNGEASREREMTCLDFLIHVELRISAFHYCSKKLLQNECKSEAEDKRINQL
jgi:hypothetical protein